MKASFRGIKKGGGRDHLFSKEREHLGKGILEFRTLLYSFSVKDRKKHRIYGRSETELPVGKEWASEDILE